MESTMTMKVLSLSLLAALASCQMPLRESAAQQQTLRDASGRTIGTATTDSQGTTTFRDASGRNTGSATHSDQGSAGGTTTLRDSSGRTTGTVSTPWNKR